jgi:hypothetical protein
MGPPRPPGRTPAKGIAMATLADKRHGPDHAQLIVSYGTRLIRGALAISLRRPPSRTIVADADARGRTGSYRVGGYTSHGKGSHYGGGH